MRRVLPFVVIAALAAAGCGGSKNKDIQAAPSAPGPTDTATTGTGAATTQTTPAASSNSGSTASIKVSKSKNLKAKPTIPKQSGSPPTQLVKEDIVKGTGATAASGDTVTVQYVGVRFRDGKQFDASWDRGQPFSFPLGAGQVIPGWDQGVAGMKVGGRRQLTIPPDLAYGAQGAPPDIGPNETLIFVVDLKKVQKG